MLINKLKQKKLLLQPIQKLLLLFQLPQLTQKQVLLLNLQVHEQN